jgi:putative RNA 2'-phosphotransferase
MLDQAKEKTLSKLMTKLLRHAPEAFGVVLNSEDGSCTVNDLIEAMQGLPEWSGIKLEDIEQVVRNSDKQRFEMENGRIRARYGHSHDKVRYEPGEPPAVLYHGTNEKALPSIREEGINPMSRQYVHLSEGTHFATLAGRRRGELVILKIDTASAKQLGITFYYAGNEVWLADHVPSACCSVWSLEEKKSAKHE